MSPVSHDGRKAIEAIAVGDRVLSGTEEGEVFYQPVTRVFQRSGAEEVAGEWVVAGRLDIGDNVVTAEGRLATLRACASSS